MHYYSVFLDLRGKRCLVVGGGRVAERKVFGLLRAGAQVRVVSPNLTPRLVVLAAKKRIALTPRAYRQGDLEEGEAPARRAPLLVFAATDDPETQAAIQRDAEGVGALVNVADDRSRSSFLVPATFMQGDLQVAISTSGASPALARRLRRQLRLALGREYQAYFSFLREARRQLSKSIPSQAQRARLLRRLTDNFMVDWIHAADPRHVVRDARKLLKKLVEKVQD
jgi:precorrin-2 dehydrogenase/sirohydrochlorin ferrochelatase